ncbi:orotidine 5'-phosphate decarboxylase [Boudabousia liubingyangii]|uniref:Orotidine-5'-phosphate decarboxylase n=1 Tax=Boudabousia liubingyangii TaxID=1921764 RepID=A0A1Q5PNJ5_9ACTO|nr:orotidine-5'-phosphate decarboxylase [Boudabousia liubingyangii]OKL49113.1 orotidine 5'-phosphate decarboxylase [Boudabousia liubingyangii]
MSKTNFGERLAAKVEEFGPVCVGVDPHPASLASWQLSDSAEGVRNFAFEMLNALGDRVAIFKPQAALFERHGVAGMTALADFLGACREEGVLTILDAKRGDIGSTMTAYAQAFMTPGADFEADAVTLSPFLGVGSLQPAFELAAENNKGAFILALTSNPEGASIQHCVSAVDSVSVAARVAQEVQERNNLLSEGAHGSFGLVVGATVGDAARRVGLDFSDFTGPLLAPGVGAQGAGGKEIREVFGTPAPFVLASASRSVAAGGPQATGLQEAFSKTVLEAKGALS